MYYEPRDGYDDDSYINVHVKRSVSNYSFNRYERGLNQREHYPDTNTGPWQELTYKKVMVIDTLVDGNNDTTFDTSYVYHHPVYLKYGDTMHIVMNACHNSNDTINDTAVADAMKLVHDSLPGVEIIIDDSSSGFYTNQDETRSYYSMQDDGGQSKTPFYLLQACHINPFNYPNCLGLLYAMGHNGLISMGTTTANWMNWYNEIFIAELKKGNNFGKAFLKQAQWKFPGRYDDGNYALLGSGTLKSRAYNPYYDYETLNLFNTDIENYNLIYVKNGVSIHDNVTVQNEGSLKIVSGEDIVITPKFLVDYGNKFEAYVDK